MKVKLLHPDLLLIAAIICFLFYSCKKDVAEDATQTVTPKVRKSWNQTVKDVALDVSKKMNSVHFRKMLKHEVSMRFDGDANILLSSIVQRLPKYFAYEAQVYSGTRAAGSDDEILLRMYDWDIIKDAAEQYPQMQLAVQPDAESWKPESYTPSVVYLTSEYDEEFRPDVHGYDPKQNPISVSTVDDPDINYVVVSNNERTTMRGEELRMTVSNCLVSEIIDVMNFNPEADAALVRPDDCPSGGGGGGSGGGGGTGGGSGSGYIQYIGVGQNGVLPTLIHRQLGPDVPLPPAGTFHRLSPVGSFSGTIVYRKNWRHEKIAGDPV